jgi:hypothetical protein
MRTAEEKGKRARTDGAEEDGGQPIDRALLLSIEKLQEIQDQIEKVSCFAFQVIWNFSPPRLTRCDGSAIGSPGFVSCRFSLVFRVVPLEIQ